MRILYRYPTAEPFVCDGFYSGVMTAGSSSDGGGAYGYVSPGGFGSILPNLEDWAIIYSVPAGALVVQDSSGFYPTSIAIDGTVYNLTSGMSDPISNPFVEGNTYDICLINETCFGYLYNLYAVDDSRELTSSADWTIATFAQVGDLSSYLSTGGGGKLKDATSVFWDSPNTGATDEFGFRGIPNGDRSDIGVFASLGTNADYWCLNAQNATNGYAWELRYNSAVLVTTANDKSFGKAVRLIKDATGTPDGTTTTYTGNDGKVYNAVAINELYWTTENLEETEYRNGDAIPNVEDNTTWANLTTGGLCLYDNNEAYACKTPLPVSSTVNYGYLYNWFTTTDVRNIANTGWKVPQASDFNTLSTYLGGDSVLGGKLKETGTEYWLSPNTGATNEVGFNARGAGERRVSPVYSFFDKDEWLYCWTTDEYADPASGYIAALSRYSSTSAYTYDVIATKQYGQSVRLIKESTTLLDGETGIYVGNDGNIYRTICIGTQEWLADNLKETKYRNGDNIPEETDQITWNTLLTGARCAYDNNESNV